MNGGISSGCHKYDDECDDCRRAETELNVSENGSDGRSALGGGENAYGGDDDYEGGGGGGESISIGINNDPCTLQQRRERVNFLSLQAPREGACNGEVKFHRRAQSEHNSPCKKSMGTNTSTPTPTAAPRIAPNFALDGR